MEGMVSLNEILIVIDEMMEMRSRCAKFSKENPKWSMYMQNGIYEAVEVAKMDDDTFERYKQSVIGRLEVCHRFSEREMQSMEHVIEFFEGKLFKDDGIDVNTWYEVKGDINRLFFS
jgi:hypothetical protein